VQRDRREGLGEVGWRREVEAVVRCLQGEADVSGEAGRVVAGLIVVLDLAAEPADDLFTGVLLGGEVGRQRVGPADRRSPVPGLGTGGAAWGPSR
jgi:hypothetical protein